MRINIKLLEDAVPEMVEVEFVYENLITSIVVSIEEASNVQKALSKVLKQSAANAEPEVTLAMKFGIAEAIFPTIVSLLRSGLKINAIKEVRGYAGYHINAEGNSQCNLGLKEAKDLCDVLHEAIKRGEV